MVVIAVLVGVLATRPTADTKVAVSPLVGKAAPEVKGTALDGRSVELASLRGRYVVVNFFATWCAPCRVEHPELIKFTQRHQGATAPAVLAIAYDENDLDSVKSFFAQKGGTWPVVPDRGGHTAVDYGVRGLPESYVISPDGIVLSHVTGGVTADGLDQLTGGVA
jgi:cytochrome c biogenesis protein CcmG/thiol:disulfide interchange protein DsbE